MTKDIEQVADKELEFSQFEQKWHRILGNSRKKSMEWIMRHADEIYQFHTACKEIELDLPVSLKVYFESKLEEWFGYKTETAKQWRLLGKNFSEMRAGKRELLLHVQLQLPPTMRTLQEIFSLDEATLKLAIDAGYINPNVTYREIKDWKAQLKQERKEAEVKAKARHKAHTDKVEEDVLYFKYADDVPEWIIETIEDLAAEIGKDKVGASLKLGSKLPSGQDTTWVCTCMNNMWTAVEFIKGAEPKDEPPPKPEKHIPDWQQHMLILGVDIQNKCFAPWALKALVKAAKHQTHPDKNDGGPDDDFKAVQQAETFFTEK
jgi:hypothetical protein